MYPSELTKFSNTTYSKMASWSVLYLSELTKFSNKTSFIGEMLRVLYLSELTKLSNSNYFKVISELILYCEYSVNSYSSIIHKSSSIIQPFSPSICGDSVGSMTTI